MAGKGNILIVENDDSYRVATARLLEFEEYVTFEAASPESADRLLQTQRIDLILIDVRLRDEFDPYDNSGVKFAETLDPDLPKILMTYHGAFHVERWLKNAATYLKNKDDDEQLVTLIDEMFQTLVRYNSKLKIKMPRNRSPEVFVQRLENKWETQPTDDILLDNFDELLRKLFLTETSIQLRDISQGRGGAGVVHITPTYDGARGAAVIVKFGEVQGMDKELQNFERFVEPFSILRTTHVIGRLEKTQYLAGFKLLVVGRERRRTPDGEQNRQTEKINNFATVFRTASADELRTAITKLFDETCELWLAGKRSLKSARGRVFKHLKNLPTTYEKQLDLNASEKVARIQASLVALHEFQKDGVQIHVSGQQIIFKQRRQTTTLPNPLYFWHTHKNRFPSTTFVAITHGDLNPHNIFVDKRGHSWLIDFQRTGWGPLMRDPAELESAIKFSLIKTRRLTTLLRFEDALLTPVSLDSDLLIPQRMPKEIQKATATISAIRQKTAAETSADLLPEYLAGLFFYALKMLTFDNASVSLVSEISAERLPIYRAHLLYSAAKIAHILTKQQEKNDV